VKRTATPGPSAAKPAPEPEALAACKYKKVELPSGYAGEVDVDAVIRALENRNAANRTAETPNAPQEAVAAEAAPKADAAPSDRMPDTDLEEIARVLKMTRSVSAAREWGLRLLDEARRARGAEKRLSGKV